MIQDIMHVGVTVSDMDRSIAFYRDVLGLQFQGELLMEGEATDKLFAAEGCRVRVAYLKGEGTLQAPPVELIQMISPKSPAADKADLFKTSISEICFETEDIEAEYVRLKAQGVEILSEPQTFDFTSSGFGKSKAIYFKDPDGIILELMQSL